MHNNVYRAQAPGAVQPPVTKYSAYVAPSGAAPNHHFYPGMPVVCSDGMLGYVARSLPTWQPHAPTHLEVHTGEHGDRSVIVPISWTIHISDAVRLRVRKRYIARRARYAQHTQPGQY